MHSLPDPRAAASQACTIARRLALCGLALTAPAHAQTSPATGPLAPLPAAAADDIPLADYLGLLQQVAPAAQDGARTYLAGVRLRCGRDLSTAELRRAMAREGGDPILMGLIKAAHQDDRLARRQLVARIPCTPGGGQ